ncbi:MAG: putative importin beta-1 subunit, partial [Streblomastix strix]
MPGQQLQEVTLNVISHVGDEQTMQLAAAFLLRQLFDVISDPAVELNLPYISQGIQDESNWHKRDAALTILSQILESKQFKLLIPSLEQIANIVMRLSLQDPIDAVKESASYAFARLLTINEQLVKKRLAEVIYVSTTLCQSSSPYIARFGCQACKVICEYAEENKSKATNFLTPHFDALFSALLQCMVRSDSEQGRLHINALEALETLIKFCADGLQTPLCVKLDNLLDNFPQFTPDQQTQGVNQPNIVEKLQNLQSAFLTIITAIVGRIGVRVNERARKIFFQLYQLTTATNITVHEDVLMCLQQMASQLGPLFPTHSEPFRQYVKDALSFFDSPEIISSALGVVSDWARATEKKFTPLLDNFVIAVVNLLKDPACPLQCQPVALEALADMALATSGEFVKYIGDIMQFSIIAAQVQVTDKNPDGTDRRESAEYVAKMHEAVLLLWTMIVEGLRDNQNTTQIQVIVPHVETMMAFVTMLIGRATADLPIPQQIIDAQQQYQTYNAQMPQNNPYQQMGQQIKIPLQLPQITINRNLPIGQGYDIDTHVFEQGRMPISLACGIIDLLI